MASLPLQVAAGGLTFDVRTDGPPDGPDDAPAVLLLHGFPATSASWDAVLPALADSGVRGFAPDQRGYSPGARPADVEAYDTDELADDVLRLADALDLPAFHLVGHDWGASVAWIVAAREPGRVISLVAASVPHLAAYGAAVRHDPEQQRMSTYIGKFRGDLETESKLLADDARLLRKTYGGFVPDDVVESYVETLRQPGALAGALAWYRAMGPGLAELGPVRVPTTFVWGADDPFIGRAAAEGCGAHVEADYRYVEVTGGSHWLPEQHPEVLAREILARSSSGR